MDRGDVVGPTMAGRPILVCIVAIVTFGAIIITGMVTHTISEGTMVMVLGLIAAVAGIGTGAHLAAAERVRAIRALGAGIGTRATDQQPAPSAGSS